MTIKYFNVKNGLTTGNILLHASNSSVVASTFTGNIVVTDSANLGAVGNITITGGSANYVLTTDGTGNLSWEAQTGSGGNANVNVVADIFTANGTGNTYTLSTTPQGDNAVIVNIDGVIQTRSSYDVSGDTLTLLGTPINGAQIDVTTFTAGVLSGSNTQIIFNDSGSPGGSANLTFNKSTNTLNATNITSNGAPVASTGKAIAMALVFGF